MLSTGDFAIRATMAAAYQPPALRRQPRQQNVGREAEIFEPLDDAACAAGQIIGAKLAADRVRSSRGLPVRKVLARLIGRHAAV
jgi:hypothetical protein